MALPQRLFNVFRRWCVRDHERLQEEPPFKTAADCSFYKRNENIHVGKSPYIVSPSSVKCEESLLTAEIFNKKNKVVLLLKVEILENNTVRFQINQYEPIRPRFEVQDVLVTEPKAVRFDECDMSDDCLQLKFKNTAVNLKYKPFKLDILVDDKVVTSVNSRGLLNFEHYRKKPRRTRNGMWEEIFHGHRDSKPRGPSSVGLDISFSDFDNVYGIPEHANSLALKSTRVRKDPYRLYNLDVFGYSCNNNQGLYGSVPYMIAHSARNTVGVFWMNASETWVDINDASQLSNVNNEITSRKIDTHWISESGIIDVFVLLGPKPCDVFQQYAVLTGPTTLPPLFALGYHQCRWNYIDQNDVLSVDKNFDQHNIPYDVIWLDIEHTDEKRYFTWDSERFPSPTEMQEKLASKGRKLVTIIDPHIKKDYNYIIYKELLENGHYVKNYLNEEYEAECWPQTSCWVDFLNPNAREWWASKFMIGQYPEATLSLHIWNDMNEPAVFGGPELTAPKDNLHYGDWEHRDVHNLYGFYNHMSSYQGMKKRSNGTKRPFVLSRSFFAGSQRFGAVWTGDNKAEWGYLKISIPMVLSLGLCGIAFAGADVGGFIGNPEAELLVRWYQTGAFLPFFRAHSEFHTKRREPWLFEETYTSLIREAVCQRYVLLPFWYTLFYENTLSGAPVVRPLWVEYPEEQATYTMDDEFLVGRDLLVKPVTSPAQTNIDVYLPGRDEVWYTRGTGRMFRGRQTRKDVETPLKMIPVYQRGGSIVPQKNTQRECSEKMHDDPYTLVIALDMAGRAKGQLYIDDEGSFDYQNGGYILKTFTYDEACLKSQCEHKSTLFETKSQLEGLIIHGFLNAPNCMIVNNEERNKDCYSFNNSTLMVNNLNLNMSDDWTIAFS